MEFELKNSYYGAIFKQDWLTYQVFINKLMGKIYTNIYVIHCTVYIYSMVNLCMISTDRYFASSEPYQRRELSPRMKLLENNKPR